MAATALNTVLRHALAQRGGAAIADADLLRRVAVAGDAAAFAALVARHGPLVWGVCRNLLPDEADADDAFQATFLTLLRSASTVRDAGRLAGWLHRVACRVALKARRGAARRRRRERAVAVPEATAVVADAAWDQLLTAVHEEVNGLPDSLRVPFVLCCLQGRRVSDAAAELGWKLGTLSARLTRARQRVLDRLARRGLPAAAAGGVAALAATTSSAAVPLGLFDQTVALGGAAGAAAPAVVQLSLGVMEMKLTRATMAGATLVIVGLLVTGLAPMLAQGPAAQSDPRSPAKPGATRPDGPPPTAGLPAGRWEYAYVEAPRPVTEASFETTCRKMEPAGWDYCGTLDMTPDPQRSKAGANTASIQVLVFKRPTKAAAAATGPVDSGANPAAADEQSQPLSRDLARFPDQQRPLPSAAQKPATAAPAKGPDLPAGEPSVSRPPFVERLVEAGKSRYRDAAQPHADVVNPARGQSESIEIIPLNDAFATKTAKMLSELFGNRGTFEADERSNSLIMRTDARTRDEVKDLLERLDKQAAIRRQRDKTLMEKSQRP